MALSEDQKEFINCIKYYDFTIEGKKFLSRGAYGTIYQIPFWFNKKYLQTKAGIKQEYVEIIIRINKTYEIVKHSNFGYVYLIQGTHNGEKKYKIGKANNLKDRLKRFEVIIPFDIDLVMSFYVKNPIQFESYLHKKYEVNRLVGEWFNFNSDNLLEIYKKGIRKETDDLFIQSDINTLENKKHNITDLSTKEYIEYLQSILTFNNIEFKEL